MSPLKGALSLAAILALSLEAMAQASEGTGLSSGADEAGPPEQSSRIGARQTSAPQTYASSFIHTIQSFGFVMGTSASGYGSSALTGERWCTGTAPCLFNAPLFLPAGARVSRIELEGCDLDPVADLTVSLVRVSVGAPTILASAETVGAAGCGFDAFAFLEAPETIVNFPNSYFVRVFSEALSTANRFTAVRILYTLQVSPAPASATFSDVPTDHPYFRFVEALADAGITAGCGGGLYCVNEPITRGEMAVFLAVGLGLHFAP